MRDMTTQAAQQEELSFDQLVELAEKDPEGLERYRQQQIKAVIDEAPEYLRQRLEGLQFQIDAQRKIHKSPMGVCIKISQMMHQSFDQLSHVLNQFSDPLAITHYEPETETAAPAATVLQFPSAKSH